MDMGILNTLLSSNNAWFSLAKQAQGKQSSTTMPVSKLMLVLPFVLSLFLQDLACVAGPQGGLICSGQDFGGHGGGIKN
jgi:hypothetical protein